MDEFLEFMKQRFRKCCDDIVAEYGVSEDIAACWLFNSSDPYMTKTCQNCSDFDTCRHISDMEG